MGILDEAIREHLELKRQHGAEGDELKRLEDEAFGPPARPGEPDFPDAEAGEGAEPVAGAPTALVDAEPETGEVAGPEAPAEHGLAERREPPAEASHPEQSVD